MKIGIYARDHQVAAVAMKHGFELHGQRALFRSLPDYGPGCVEAFDLVVIVGLRGKGADALRDYQARDVPALVVDYGYLSRANAENAEGYWQVGLGGLNKIPEFECPSDRFDALGLKINAPVGGSGPAILCGQVVGDAAHPFDTEEKLQAWVESVDHDEYRAHPVSSGDAEPLEALLARAGKIITWNSNIGHDALLAGVPVEAHGPAPYAGVALKDREAYFARVAYGQWTVQEMEEGLAAAFAIEKLLGQPAEAKSVEDVANTLAASESALSVVHKGRGKYSVVRADGSVVADSLTKAAADAMAQGKA